MFIKALTSLIIIDLEKWIISWLWDPETYLGYADVLTQATQAAEDTREGLAGLEGEVELVGASVA